MKAGLRSIVCTHVYCSRKENATLYEAVVECQKCGTKRTPAGLAGIHDNCPYGVHGYHAWKDLTTKENTMHVEVTREEPAPPPIKSVVITMNAEDASRLLKVLITAHKSYGFEGQHMFLQPAIDALKAQGVS